MNDATTSAVMMIVTVFHIQCQGEEKLATGSSRRRCKGMVIRRHFQLVVAFSCPYLTAIVVAVATIVVTGWKERSKLLHTAVLGKSHVER
jgi:hypothetical protein